MLLTTTIEGLMTKKSRFGGAATNSIQITRHTTTGHKNKHFECCRYVANLFGLQIKAAAATYGDQVAEINGNCPAPQRHYRSRRQKNEGQRAEKFVSRSCLMVPVYAPHQ